MYNNLLTDKPTANQKSVKNMLRMLQNKVADEDMMVHINRGKKQEGNHDDR